MIPGASLALHSNEHRTGGTVREIRWVRGFPGVWVSLGLVSGCVDVVLGVWVPAFG